MGTDILYSFNQELVLKKTVFKVLRIGGCVSKTLEARIIINQSFRGKISLKRQHCQVLFICGFSPKDQYKN